MRRKCDRISEKRIDKLAALVKAIAWIVVRLFPFFMSTVSPSLILVTTDKEVTVIESVGVLFFST